MKKLLRISSIVGIIFGIIFVIGGSWGIYFTYQSVAKENIVTPEDAVLPNKPVRGPFTLKTQADTIRKHVLVLTDGKTYAEMSREDPARATWVTATTLTTALNLAILTYAFSGVVLFLGFILIWISIVVYILNRE